MVPAAHHCPEGVWLTGVVTAGARDDIKMDEPEDGTPLQLWLAAWDTAGVE